MVLSKKEVAFLKEFVNNNGGLTAYAFGEEQMKLALSIASKLNG